MLYPHVRDATLSPELFLHPGAEYRGAPFWSWNNRLVKEELLTQIDTFREMGMGGFHIHCRSGLETDYLGKEFMELIRASNERAKAAEMLCWLYDEDRWPSGAAGGLVTRDPATRMRYLLFTPWPYGDPRAPEPRDQATMAGAMVDRNSSGELLVRYAVRLEGGRLADYRRLGEGESAGEGYREWFLYREIAAGRPWYNNQSYVDTLSKAAVERFVQVTHEAYFREVGEDFGGSIPAIFSDEPQFAHKTVLGFAEEERDLIIPYTDDFPDSYRRSFGEDFLATLPELFWEGDRASTDLVRYRYHDHVAERFAAAFADTVGAWCAAHDLMLTGHMMEEPTLHSQTAALGEAMRSYRGFQLPGIDMLSDRREYTTAKQAQSAAHQLGAPGVLSELYGVTGWHFDFRGHKLQGDWQAALGVTVRVHHLTWVSMAGESKRDYPASIGYQSPWYREYPMVEDHFARVNAAMTRGRPLVRVAVVHPIESYWLAWGPSEQTALDREELESNFENIVNWMLFGQLDFDFLAESLLPGRSRVAGGRLVVGEMAYEVVIVPGCRTIRDTTLELLDEFRNQGGRLLFLGGPPSLVSAVASEAPRLLAERSAIIPFSRSELLRALEPVRELEMRTRAGRLHDNLFYQLRLDGTDRWLFVCHVRPPENPDLPEIERVHFLLSGSFDVTLYDTGDGSTRGLASVSDDGRTRFAFDFACHDSLLLRLSPRSEATSAPAGLEEGATPAAAVVASSSRRRRLSGPVEIELSEPNVLLLDRAEYRFREAADWQPADDILRIDNGLRRELGWPERGGRMAQPWVEPDDPADLHELFLRFRIVSAVAVAGARLALEWPREARIVLNGREVVTEPQGWFVDKAIETVSLPDLPAGESELLVTLPITRRRGAEWLYLLGDFGVEVAGAGARLIAPVRKLAFGDWSRQGLPFYAGNVTYRVPVVGGGRRAIQVPQFRNPVLTVALDGRPAGRIAYSPYVCNLGEMGGGEHLVEITAFGNRANAFGPVHNCNDAVTWWGPPAWRTSGWEWSDEYRLRATGILTAPWLIEE